MEELAKEQQTLASSGRDPPCRHARKPLPLQRSLSADVLHDPTLCGVKGQSSFPHAISSYSLESRAKPPSSPWHDGPSPEGRGAWDEEPVFEIWASSTSAHHSVATVMEYNGKFVNLDVSLAVFGVLWVMCELWWRENVHRYFVFTI